MKSTPEGKQRLLSGIKPTGRLHIGNYFGAVAPQIALQDTHDCVWMVADLHSLSVRLVPAELRKCSREIQ